ncbi:hypothetical protein SAMN04489727_4591 [Amycolatopsis tolypomycina]|uniref:Uncharacterized protein n=1 Tax=Amycolatopsis tolypomycina TaxID=208445 RepID=A0A1H4UCB0_9PSEU|nr:hypothetical protein [Amycolatopsis tolypomycina]SEC66243.1 hypothetical protein SAMN04489727_4591 [Amycolatopsis tolypomycina]
MTSRGRVALVALVCGLAIAGCGSDRAGAAGEHAAPGVGPPGTRNDS